MQRCCVRKTDPPLFFYYVVQHCSTTAQHCINSHELHSSRRTGSHILHGSQSRRSGRQVTRSQCGPAATISLELSLSLAVSFLPSGRQIRIASRAPPICKFVSSQILLQLSVRHKAHSNSILEFQDHIVGGPGAILGTASAAGERPTNALPTFSIPKSMADS